MDIILITLLVLLVGIVSTILYLNLRSRPKNEDELVAIKNSDNNNNLLKPYNLYSIFDGHGGSKVSKYLKEKLPPFFINKMVDFYSETNDVSFINLIGIVKMSTGTFYLE